jgi:hypothetical protein
MEHSKIIKITHQNRIEGHTLIAAADMIEITPTDKIAVN